MNVIKFITQSDQKWHLIKFRTDDKFESIILLFLPLLPSLAFSLGAWLIGWSIKGQENYIRLSLENSLSLGLVIYFSFLSTVITMGGFVNWLSKKFNDEKSFDDSLTLCTYLSLPYSIIGILAIYPNKWIIFSAFLIASLMSLRLLYSGLIHFVKIKIEYVFKFSIYVVMFFISLVSFVFILDLSVWRTGIHFSMEYIIK